MRKHDYQFVKDLFSRNGCVLTEDHYVNNSTHMKFICKCGNASQITFNQFCKSPQCASCGVEEMKRSKNSKARNCRVCGISVDKPQRSGVGNICHPCYNNKHRIWQKPNGKKYYLAHRDQIVTHCRERRRTNKDHINLLNQKSRDKLKMDVFSYYSPELKCVKCGYDNIMALSIDHIDGSGKAHRKELGRKHMYCWLRQNGYPEGFQVLCMNCQFIKRHENGECKRKLE